MFWVFLWEERGRHSVRTLLSFPRFFSFSEAILQSQFSAQVPFVHCHEAISIMEWLPRCSLSTPKPCQQTLAHMKVHQINGPPQILVSLLSHRCKDFKMLMGSTQLQSKGACELPVNEQLRSARRLCAVIPSGSCLEFSDLERLSLAFLLIAFQQLGQNPSVFVFQHETMLRGGGFPPPFRLQRTMLTWA